MKKFSARLLLSYSQSTKRDIEAMYKKNPKFPQDPEGVDQLLKHLESLLPTGIPEGKQKLYTKYLAKQLFGPQPSWVMNEDEPRVKSTLEAFEVAIKDKRLTGNATNIDTYDTLADVMEASTVEKETKDRTGFTLDNLPEQADLGGQPGNPRAEVAAGSKIIADEGGWRVYRIEKGDPKGKVAGSWLGANKWWGVKWCVGRDYSSDAWQSRPYMDNGHFYFFAKNGRSKYAMSTDGNSADLYNPADAVIWTTNNAQASGNFPALQATADSMGADMDLSGISTLPPELLPILRAATEVDPYLKKMVPESQLAERDTTVLDSIIAATPADKLVQDLNSNSGFRSKSTVEAILLRCTSKTNKSGVKDFSQMWGDMNENTMVLYIEALARNGWKSLPTSLENYFIQEAENFSF